MMSDGTMTKTELLQAIDRVRYIEVWVQISKDDGDHFRVSKAEARRRFAHLSGEEWDGTPIKFLARCARIYGEDEVLLING